MTTIASRILHPFPQLTPVRIGDAGGKLSGRLGYHRRASVTSVMAGLPALSMPARARRPATRTAGWPAATRPVSTGAAVTSTRWRARTRGWRSAFSYDERVPGTDPHRILVGP